MSAFIARRLGHACVVLFVVSLLTFLLVNLAPGGPALMTTMQTTPQQREALRVRFGLDRPVLARFGTWMWASARGDLGRSLNDGRPVTEIIGERLPPTIVLAGLALFCSILIGIPAGVFSAIHRGSSYDYLITFFSVVGVSVPGFWFAIMLILVLSVFFRWLPSSGIATIGAPFSLLDRTAHLLMPTIVLVTVSLPQLVRFTRSAMLEILSQDFVRTARAKGLWERSVRYRHAFRNAMIPVVTIVGILVPRLVGGSVITETIFGWPGMGQLAVTAAIGRDYPLVMVITVVVATVVILANLAVDVAYGWLDPRIRYE
jgi:peptide/nickel transport system permease protein